MEGRDSQHKVLPKSNSELGGNSHITPNKTGTVTENQAAPFSYLTFNLTLSFIKDLFITYWKGRFRFIERRTDTVKDLQSTGSLSK